MKKKNKAQSRMENSGYASAQEDHHSRKNPRTLQVYSDIMKGRKDEKIELKKNYKSTKSLDDFKAGQSQQM